MDGFVLLTIANSRGFDVPAKWYFGVEAEAYEAKELLYDVGFEFDESHVDSIPAGDFESVACELETTLELASERCVEEGIL